MTINNEQIEALQEKIDELEATVTEELQEKIDELETTITNLIEELAFVKDDNDNLREEFEEHVREFSTTMLQTNTVVEQMKRFIDMSYRFDKQRDVLRVQAQITRDMLEYAGPEALDLAYQNMKDQLTETMKTPYNTASNFKYNAPTAW